jgi:hypothetical protein
MRDSLVGLATASLLAAGALVACSHDAAPGSCFDMSAPGVVIYIPAIDLLVRDASGRGEAFGTKVVVYDGADSTMATGSDTLHVFAGYTYAGSFTVHVNRQFYRETVLSNVAVVNGQCSAVVTHIPVTLQLAPGAPPIRSLAVFGATFLSAPGEQRQLSARFDADPGISTTVNWRLSDTTLARIDGVGLVTAKCSLAGGVETVTAIAAVDTAFKATAQFGVAKETTCA